MKHILNSTYTNTRDWVISMVWKPNRTYRSNWVDRELLPVHFLNTKNKKFNFYQELLKLWSNRPVWYIKQAWVFQSTQGFLFLKIFAKNLPKVCIFHRGEGHVFHRKLKVTDLDVLGEVCSNLFWRESACVKRKEKMERRFDSFLWN